LGLATAGIAVSCVWVLVLAVLVALAATGSFGISNAEQFGGARKPVARLVDDLQSALDDNDGRRVCDELFSERWATLVARGSGRSCVGFVDHVEAGRRQADLDVRSITITGDVATAQVDEGGTRETMRFLRVGGRWRVDEISR
jgi:hypothetical protein